MAKNVPGLQHRQMREEWGRRGRHRGEPLLGKEGVACSAISGEPRLRAPHAASRRSGGWQVAPLRRRGRLGDRRDLGIFFMVFFWRNFALVALDEVAPVARAQDCCFCLLGLESLLLASRSERPIKRQLLDSFFLINCLLKKNQLFDSYLRHARYTHSYHMNSRTPYLYEHLWETEPAYLEVDEVTTNASLLAGMSHTSDSIVSLNPEINPGNTNIHAKSRT
jgi:hypothetical protein